jgi:hypothetical protein
MEAVIRFFTPQEGPPPSLAVKLSILCCLIGFFAALSTYAIESCAVLFGHRFGIFRKRSRSFSSSLLSFFPSFLP